MASIVMRCREYAQRKSVILFFLCLLTVIILSCLPGTELKSPSWFSKWHGDKLVHVIMYATLTTLALWSCHQVLAHKWSSFKITLVVYCSMVLIGAALEYVQGHWIDHRDQDVLDLLSNSAGSLIAICIPWRKSRYHATNHQLTHNRSPHNR